MRKIKPFTWTKKTLETVAWSLAGVVMVGALTYYNFIDKAPAAGVEVGNHCPDFTAQTYQVQGDTFSPSGETFTLSQQIGKVVIVNFWEVWCQGCIMELPEFNEIQEEYGDKVEVIAIAGVTSTIESAAKWMSEKKWLGWDDKHDWVDFSITFGYLPTAVCTELGCSGMLLRTIVVDKSGIVTYAADSSMTYDKLQEIVESLL